jgi:hypothetical protein
VTLAATILSDLIADNRQPLFEDLHEHLLSQRKPIHVYFSDKDDHGTEVRVDALLLPLEPPSGQSCIVFGVNQIVEV